MIEAHGRSMSPPSTLAKNDPTGVSNGHSTNTLRTRANATA